MSGIGARRRGPVRVRVPMCSWSAPLLSVLSLPLFLSLSLSLSLSSSCTLVCAATPSPTKFGTSGVTKVEMTYTNTKFECRTQGTQNIVRYEWTISQTDSSSAQPHQPQDTTGTPVVTLTFNHVLLTVGNSYPTGTVTTIGGYMLNQTTINFGPNVVQEITFAGITCANYNTLYYTMRAKAPATGTTQPMLDFPTKIVDANLPITPAPTTPTPTTPTPTTPVPTSNTTTEPSTTAPPSTTPGPGTPTNATTPNPSGSPSSTPAPATDLPSSSPRPTSTSPTTESPTVPSGRCTTWRVRANDTLATIATKFHVTLPTIRINNPDMKNDVIIIGEILKVVCPATPDSDAIANEGSNPSVEPSSSSPSSSSATIQVIAIIVPIGVILLFALISVALVRYRRTQYHDHVNKLRLQQLAENSPSPSTIPSSKSKASRSIMPKQDKHDVPLSLNPAATITATPAAGAGLSSLFGSDDGDADVDPELLPEAPQPQGQQHFDTHSPDNHV